MKAEETVGEKDKEEWEKGRWYEDLVGETAYEKLLDF